MQVPPAFACPITGYCMLDPVMAADGNTYERVAIQQWLQHQCTSPMTRATLEFVDLYPNHEKKAEINGWRKSQKPGQPHAKAPKTNKPRLDKLTWATTPSQAVDELNSLISSVKSGSCELTKSQLNRIRGCLSADQHMWTQKVQRKFQALEGHCLGYAASSNSRESEAAGLSNLSSEDSEEVLQPFESCLNDNIQSVTDSDVTQMVPRSNQMQFDARGQMGSIRSPAKLDHSPCANQPSAQCLQTKEFEDIEQKADLRNNQTMFDITPRHTDREAEVKVSASVSARGGATLNLATNGDDSDEDFHECRDFLMGEGTTTSAVSRSPGPIALCEYDFPTNYDFPSNSSMDLEATLGQGYTGFAVDEAACATTFSESVTKTTSRDRASAPYTAASLKKQTVPELRALCSDKGLENSGRKDDLINRILSGASPFISREDSFPHTSLHRSQSEATFETLESSYGDYGARLSLDSNSRRPKRVLESDEIESATKLKHSKSVGDLHSAFADDFYIEEGFEPSALFSDL